MSGVTGGAVGEGMSDALANYFNGDDRVAEYSSNNPIGIRQYPYTNYPRTYGLVVGILGPHLDGEIYAATLVAPASTLARPGAGRRTSCCATSSTG